MPGRVFLELKVTDCLHFTLSKNLPLTVSLSSGMLIWSPGAWVSRQIHILYLTVAFCRSRVRTQLQCVVCIPTPSISCSQCSPRTEQLAAEQISSQPS